MVTLSVRTQGFDRLRDPALLKQAELDAVTAATRDVVHPIAKGEAPTRTGQGKNFIFWQVDAGPLGRVYVSGRGFYLRILATGAKAHEVRARSRGRRVLKVRQILGRGQRPPALMFTVGGSRLFRGAVRIPALRPNPWMERAAKAAEPKVESVAQAAIDRAMRGLG